MAIKPTSIRLDEADKQTAYKIFESLGIKPSQAFDMFIKQVILTKGMPFDVKIPNQETIDAMNEDYSKLKGYTNVDEMMQDLVGEYV